MKTAIRCEIALRNSGTDDTSHQDGPLIFGSQIKLVLGMATGLTYYFA
ncbi:MAG: hypothetical protein KME20_00905 [Kaiparowitsia implicata GSE-PSE-MK54-09C]|nr:hypothetical protein [Kaiparowitsia implicata GSE-PSE-MK54-09C]